MTWGSGKRMLLLSLSILAVVFIGCGGAGSSGDFTDPANPIKVSAGQTFTITLDSNPSTGYKWDLAGALDEKIVQLVKSEYKPPAEQIPGRGGKETWTFKATGKGETRIALKYIRPWEKDVTPAAAKTFIVVVQ